MVADGSMWGVPGAAAAGAAYRQRHPLIGREAELRTIIGRLRSADASIITITGRDGSGRTRLGLAALAAIAPDLPGGGAVLSMASIDDRGTLLSTLAERLGVAHDGGSTPESAVEERLLQLPTAILADDADGRTELLAELARLMVAGDGRLIATARRPLEVPGEHVIRLGSLGLPDATAEDPGRIASSPAVALYLAHARAADHRFTPGPDVLRLVAEVCRRLDGLPGAIELAASRVTLLPPARLLAWLERAPLAAAVRRPAPGTPTRPTGLGAVLASVHETLSPDAAVVLRRVAGLAGPMPLDGLERIAADPDWAPDRLLDAVNDLVDCHLLDATGDDEPRFSLPVSVATFARGHLDAAGEHDLVAARRNAWCVASMAGRGAHFDAALPTASMDDLVASLEDLLERGNLSETLQLAVDCSPTWSHAAWSPRAERVMRLALERAAERGDPPVPADVVIRARIWFARLTTDRPDQPATAEQAATFRSLVEDARSTGDVGLLLLAHASLALALPLTRDFAGAAASIAEGLGLAAGFGDPFWATRFLYWSGMMAARLGDHRTAAALGGQGMAAALASGDRAAQVPAGILLHHMAVVGEIIPPSTPSQEELLATARAIPSALAEGWVLALMAHEAVERGDLEEAMNRSTELLQNGQRNGSHVALVLGLAALAGVAAERHELAVAARLAGMIAKDMLLIGTAGPAQRVASFQARLERARAEAGAGTWDQHAAAGAMLSSAAAVHEALTWAASIAGPIPAADGAIGITDRGSAALTPVAEDDRDAGALMATIPDDTATDPLTPREEQVLRRIARGDSNKDIATDLGMSPKTVMHHSMSIYRKLGVRGRSEATAWAYRHGLMAGARPDTPD